MVTSQEKAMEYNQDTYRQFCLKEEKPLECIETFNEMLTEHVFLGAFIFFIVVMFSAMVAVSMRD